MSYENELKARRLRHPTKASLSWAVSTQERQHQAFSCFPVLTSQTRLERLVYECDGRIRKALDRLMKEDPDLVRLRREVL